MYSHTHYFAGVDGGGTKCRAVLFDQEGNALGAGLAGPGNVSTGNQKALQAIIDAVSHAIADAGLSTSITLQQVSVGAGLAGGHLPSAAAILTRWQHPFANFAFTSDLHAAMLGAHGGADGAVLVVGTGSCAAAIRQGNVEQFGGHGFLLGDKGSGAWLGRQAVKYTLEALDGVKPTGRMVETVCRYYQSEKSLGLVDALIQAPPAKFAEFSPELVALAKQGDDVAVRIVEEGSAYLSQIALRALAQTEKRLVLVGGVAEVILPWLHQDVQQVVVPSQHGPEWGAVLFYQQSQQSN